MCFCVLHSCCCAKLYSNHDFWTLAGGVIFQMWYECNLATKWSFFTEFQVFNIIPNFVHVFAFLSCFQMSESFNYIYTWICFADLPGIHWSQIQAFISLELELGIELSVNAGSWVKTTSKPKGDFPCWYIFIHFITFCCFTAVDSHLLLRSLWSICD